MSPRAACRLEAFGFEVHDYVAGKADWLAAGLGTEGPGASTPRAGAAADRAVPTCRLGEPVGSVARRTLEAGWEVAVVVTDGFVVAGTLRGDALRVGSQDAVEEAMAPGPSTIRADVPLGDIHTRMAQRGVPDVVVTTPEGRLIGVLRRPGEAVDQGS